MSSVREPPVRESDADSTHRFSVRGLFAFTTLVTVSVGFLVAAPDLMAGVVLAFVIVALPMTLTIILIHGQSFQQTFCIGALFPAVTVLFSFAWSLGLVMLDAPPAPGNFEEFFEDMGQRWRPYAAMSWVSVLVLGLLSVGLRVFIERNVSSKSR